MHDAEAVWKNRGTAQRSHLVRVDGNSTGPALVAVCRASPHRDLENDNLARDTSMRVGHGPSCRCTLVAGWVIITGVSYSFAVPHAGTANHVTAWSRLNWEEDAFMQQFLAFALMVVFAVPAFAGTQRRIYSVSCEELWPAVKDALLNSGRFSAGGIDDGAMMANFSAGKAYDTQHANTVFLSPQASGCELKLKTSLSSFFVDDADLLKAQVDHSLARHASGAAFTPAPAEKSAAPAPPAPTPAPDQSGDVPEASSPAPAPPAKATLPTQTALVQAGGVQVVISSTPDGADIEIDGRFVGNTPSTIELAPGDHTFAVHKRGYKEWKRQVRTTGGSIHLNADLKGGWF